MFMYLTICVYLNHAYTYMCKITCVYTCRMIAVGTAAKYEMSFVKLPQWAADASIYEFATLQLKSGILIYIWMQRWTCRTPRNVHKNGMYLIVYKLRG